MHIFELDRSIHRLKLFAFIRPSVDGWLPVEELTELSSGVLGLAHVRREREDSSGRLRTKENLTEADKESENVILVVTEQGTTIPEAKRDTEEHQGLG